MKVNTKPLKADDIQEWTSSKGNQNKWFKDGIWYKEDGLGYEALSEILVSRLLAKTNTDHFVSYGYEPLEKGKQVFRGCCSADFMTPMDDKLVSVERLFQTYKGESAAKAILKFTETEDRIRYVAENVAEITDMLDFGDYLKKMITVDAFFLNEDRHFHNIAVIRRKDGTYRECPIFDNGAALFSDIRGDYPLELNLEKCYEKIQAKPFAGSFDDQIDACDILFGGFRFKAGFTMKDVDAVLAEFDGIYEDEILERVRQVMRIQMRKYEYLFFAH